MMRVKSTLTLELLGELNRMWFLFAFLAVPITEIALFIQIGGLIGLWPTLAVVVITALIGSWLVRSQGIMEINNIRRSISRLDDPVEPIAKGLMILVAGALLLTPGFFTDGAGFALLVPAVRSAVFNQLRKRVGIRELVMEEDPRSRHYGGHGDIIDGEFNVEREKRP